VYEAKSKKKIILEKLFLVFTRFVNVEGVASSLNCGNRANNN
jgi:hypothetical protein